MDVLFEPLTLKCGATIKNRFAKAAMSEAMGDSEHAPQPVLLDLYRRWARGGTGLVITGNVMVDHTALGEPGNVVIEDDRHLEKLQAWAKAGTQDGAHLWMQINHPGKQSPRTLSPEPVSASAIPMPGMTALFTPPRALTTDEVRVVVARYVTAARVAQQAGFTGVQIHGAHGYLVNQFLSAADNQRTDCYGGPLEARMRFLREIYAGMRETLGDDYPISLKLNSSDFVDGGLTEDESLHVITTLAADGLDLVEVSGGTYRNAVVADNTNPSSGVYFSDYARRLRDSVDIPVMLTGGFRQADAMREALEAGTADLVGLGRPLVIEPELPLRIRDGRTEPVVLPRIRTGVSKIDSSFGPLLGINWYELQMRRIAEGKQAESKASIPATLWYSVSQHGPAALLPRRARRK